MVGPVRPKFVLFGSSIVRNSFSNEGWGAILATLYARKGPCSRKADATDEQPGPKKREEAHGQTPKRSKMYTINRKKNRVKSSFSDIGDVIKSDTVILPPFSQRTRGFEPGCDSASTK
ncbi:gdsl esterase/lipase [Quercus suber]|uniref:Gdsl esterase/lipase n=1 Tax=Quercus suber TaxID=58331 RepID=A0AAW0KAP4_QUESU